MTVDEIANIVTETVLETEKDLQKFHAVLTRIAGFALIVAESLRDNNIAITHPKTRDLKTHGMVQKALQNTLTPLYPNQPPTTP